MPWVNEEMCTGCGTCVEECPSGAMSLQAGTAVIDEAECIRCGKCHDVCPEEAVRHDSGQIPREIEAHVQRVLDLASKYEGRVAKKDLVDRWTRYFQKQMKVAEETLRRLKAL